MSREVRRVAKDWQHPKELNWNRTKMIFIALLPGDRYEAACKDYEEDGEEPPPRSDFMPSWTKEEATHWQMYETCSEGTPSSPVMESPEELANWLVANRASTWGLPGDNCASFETWMGIIQDGDEPMLIFSADKGLRIEVM